MKILNKWVMLKRAESACIHEERDVLGLDDRRWSQTVTTPSKMRTSIFIYHSHVASPFKKKKSSANCSLCFFTEYRKCVSKRPNCCARCVIQKKIRRARCRKLTHCVTIYVWLRSCIAISKLGLKSFKPMYCVRKGYVSEPKSTPVHYTKTWSGCSKRLKRAKRLSTRWNSIRNCCGYAPRWRNKNSSTNRRVSQLSGRLRLLRSFNGTSDFGISRLPVPFKHLPARGLKT